MTGSRISGFVIFFAVLLFADWCYGYGGWDYSDPGGQAIHVLSLLLRNLWWIVILPYVCLAFVSYRFPKRTTVQIILPLVLFSVYSVLLPALSVMGEMGPAHLAAGLFFVSIIIALSMLVIRILIQMIFQDRNDIARKLALKAVVTLEIFALIGIFLLPFFTTGSRMARDGQAKCLWLTIRATSMQIEYYQKQTGSLPDSMEHLLDWHGSNSNYLVCPVTGKPYEYHPNTDNDSYILTCPQHGSKQFNIEKVE